MAGLQVGWLLSVLAVWVWGQQFQSPMFLGTIPPYETRALISYIIVFSLLCYFLSVATASQQEQSGDFLFGVRVDDDSQEMLFEECSEQSAETKHR